MRSKAARRARNLAASQPVNRTIVAPSRPATMATNPAMRATRVGPTGNVQRAPRARMTGAQRNSLGKRSEWNESPYYRTSATIDARWNNTVSTS